MLTVPVACLSDNYAYILIAPGGNECMVVDPSEGAPVLAALAAHKTRDGRPLTVTAILCTHHHPDHVGGVEELMKELHVANVYGFESDRGRIPGQTRFLADGEKFPFEGLEITAMHIPGHTLGAVAYVVREGAGDPVVFTGDTLFVGGCGRVFEGTPEMMHASLQRLARLPGETRVYCGHEYTESNYRFAATLEPSNMSLTQARERAAAAIRANKPTVPSTISEELATNPFLRVDAAELRKTMKMDPSAAPVDVFARVRAAKDVFRPSAPLSQPRTPI
jgi:hydroxyacylglutathione hydrolase